jgi:DME family drug/metabolite transporter
MLRAGRAPLRASDGLVGLSLVSTAAVLWGTVGVANSLMTDRAAVDPSLAGLTRTALGAASLLAAARVLGVPRAPAGPVPLRLLAVFGVAGAVFQVCLFAAFAVVGVTITVAVTVCAPVVLVAAADAAWHRNPPELAVILAIAIAAAGVILALSGGWAAPRPADALDPRGAVLLVIASVAFALVAATARAMARRLHPLRATGLGLAATAAALALVVLGRAEASMADLGALPGRDLGVLLYTGVAATGGAYYAFVRGLDLSRSAGAGLAATMIEPGVAALLAALVLRERLAAPEAAGCALMLAAMVLLFAAERRAVRSPSPRARRSSRR